MKRKLISYKLQSYLALIPIFGFFIVLFIAWINIYKATKKKLYVFIYDILLIVLISIVGIIMCLLYFCFIIKIDSIIIKEISMFLLSYIVCLMSALLSLAIEKKIIKKFSEKMNIQEIS